MDVVIIFGDEKFIVELKIWDGKRLEEKGRQQLGEYLDIQKLDTGYLIIFNFNKNKKYGAGWVKLSVVA